MILVVYLGHGMVHPVLAVLLFSIFFFFFFFLGDVLSSRIEEPSREKKSGAPVPQHAMFYGLSLCHICYTSYVNVNVL